MFKIDVACSKASYIPLLRRLRIAISQTSSHASSRAQIIIEKRMVVAQLSDYQVALFE